MLKTRRFTKRVGVYRDGERIYYAAHAAAAHLLDTGLATVRLKTAKVITEVDLTRAALGTARVGRVPAGSLELWPGSYGVRVEALGDGLFCFAHRNPWDQVAVAA